MPVLAAVPPRQLTTDDIPAIVKQALDTVVYTDRNGAKIPVKSPRGPYAYDQIISDGSIDKRLDLLEATVRALDAALKANGIDDDALTAAVSDLVIGFAEVREALAKPILPA